MLFKQLQNSIEIEIQNNIKAQDEAQTEANSHGGAMVSRYDTFKEEAQYLVNGYKKKILELRADLVELQSFLLKINIASNNSNVHVGNVVITENEKKELKHYLYSPVGGGKKFEVNGIVVIIVTPVSPFGKILNNKSIGDELNIGIKQKIISIL